MTDYFVHRMFVASAIAVTLLLLIAGNIGVRAQGDENTPTPTPSPTPKSPDVLRLEEEKARALLRQAIAEANKAELEARFPKSTVTPLSGATTIDENVLIETQMVAYVSLARAANKIVDAIKKYSALNLSRIAVYSDDDIKLLLSYKIGLDQIDVLRKSYCSLIANARTDRRVCPLPLPQTDPSLAPPSVIANPIAIASSLLGSFVDLTSLFRTNVEIKGQVFEIDEAPLVAEFFRAARRPGELGLPRETKFYYPKMFSPYDKVKQEYIILGKLDDLQTLRNMAGRMLAELEQNEQDINKAENSIKNLELSKQQLITQILERKTQISVILQAHCADIPPDQRNNPEGIEERLKRSCPRLSGEHRERIFKLASEIMEFIENLNGVNGVEADLTQGRDRFRKLVETRTKLWANFQVGLGEDQGVNALAVADAAAQLKARNQQFDRFIDGLTQPSASGPNMLTMYIKAEHLGAAITESNNQNSYWLQLKVVKAGGNNRIKTNLIWDIFTGGNRLSHSGGVIVEYILFNTAGQSIVSDTIAEYTGYIKADKVRRLPNQEIDDCPSGTKSGTCRKESYYASDSPSETGGVSRTAKTRTQ